MKKPLVQPVSARQLIKRLIVVIDHRLNNQVNRVMHHANFQRLESRWRGLLQLAKIANKNKYVKVRMLDVDYETLNHDIVKNSNFEQSHLFKKVYSEEFDQPGGEPFGLLVGDYTISHMTVSSGRDGIEFLRQMAQIGASCFAPFVASIDASFFGINNFSELKSTHKLDELLASDPYRRWHQLRQDDNAHFLALTLPQVLMRLPYNNSGTKFEHRFFKEILATHDDYLWGNASFIYAQAVLQSYIESGWFVKMRGIGIANQNSVALKLPRHFNRLPKSKLFPTISTETLLSDNQEKHLSDLGFIPLRDHVLPESVALYSNQSIKLPKRARNDSRQVNYKLNTLLHYILCASRFAHYIKVIMRDKVGKFISANECESFISRWINQYCSATQGQSAEALAKQPLQAAQVSVKALPGRIGHYFCEMDISPHSQIDEVYSRLTLLTKIKLG